VPLSQTGAELLFEVFSQRYERGSTVVTSNLPFDEWTSVFGSERLTGALLDRLTHRVHILKMNGGRRRRRRAPCALIGNVEAFTASEANRRASFREAGVKEAGSEAPGRRTGIG
jgi:hypothetical protein